MEVSRLCVTGASLDTGNLGVSALCLGTLRALFVSSPSARVTVFDEGRGRRETAVEVGGLSCRYELCGRKASRRLWQAETLWNTRVCCWFGGLGNQSARAVLEADAVLDLSGGDSFTDMYGARRFRSETLAKRIAIENGIPLVLMPQTYGPFQDRRRRAVAESIVRRATMAWARDARSFEELRRLLGDAFDPERHLCGIDMAFCLEGVRPSSPLPDPLAAWIERRDGVPLVGVNVSGLIYNDPVQAAARYGLKADYRKLIEGLVTRLLTESDARVVLVPHVVTPRGHFESDVDACESVARRVEGAAAGAGRGRVAVAPAMQDPRHAKWLISKTDWFCGTRMHSTIAALSSGVPTAAVAYSIKTQGVFDGCGLGDHVADPRAGDEGELRDQLWRSWTARRAARETLGATAAGAARRAESQVLRVIEYLAKTRGTSPVTQPAGQT